jgi:pilus assembly protein CpaB
LAIDEIISTSPKKSRDGGSRKSGARAMTFTVIALVAGVAVAAILKSYVDRHLSSGPPVTNVVAATMDLPQATTLLAEHLTVVQWPTGARPEGTFADPKDLVGRVLLSKVVKNEPVLSTKLASREAGSGMASLLPENMRAAAVRVDDVVGVAGFIHPDDHVDVIVTMHAEKGETVSRVILQNVRVLAVGQQLGIDEQKRNQAMPVTVATLLVSTEESEMLALASAQGRLLLTLRPWADKNQIATTGVGPTQLLAGSSKLRPVEPEHTKSEGRLYARTAAPPPPPIAAAAPAAPAPAASETVEILRGDRFEQRKFEHKSARSGE